MTKILSIFKRKATKKEREGQRKRTGRERTKKNEMGKESIFLLLPSY